MQAKPNPLKTKSLQFAVDIIEVTTALNEMRQYVVAKQLTKPGTSIGAIFTKHKHLKAGMTLYTS